MARRNDPGRADPARVLLSGAAGSLSDAALVALLLGSDDAALGDAVINENPPPDAFWRMSAEDLTRHRGIGPVAASRLLACLEMSRRASAWKMGDNPTLSRPEDVVAMCAPRLRGADREHFWALPLNTKNRLLRLVEVSVGSLNVSIVHPRELFKEAVRLSAASLLVVHNHPSGDPTPSSADIQLTRRLVRAGDVLGIEVLDHVVIGDGGSWTSMRESGLM